MGFRELKDSASLLFGKKKFDKAAAAYLTLIEADPQNPHLRLRYAEVCCRLRQLELASRAYLVAGQLFGQRSQLSCARAALRLAADLAPDDARILGELERVEMELAAQRTRRGELPIPQVPPVAPVATPPKKARRESPRFVTFDGEIEKGDFTPELA